MKEFISDTLGILVIFVGGYTAWEVACVIAYGYPMPIHVYVLFMAFVVAGALITIITPNHFLRKRLSKKRRSRCLGYIMFDRNGRIYYSQNNRSRGQRYAHNVRRRSQR